MSQSNVPPGDAPLPKTVFLTPGAEFSPPPSQQPAAHAAEPATPTHMQPGYRAALARPANGASHEAVHPGLPRELSLSARLGAAPAPAAQAPQPHQHQSGAGNAHGAPASNTPVANSPAGALNAVQPQHQPAATPPDAPNAAPPAASAETSARPQRRKTFEDEIESDFGPMTTPVPAGVQIAPTPAPGSTPKQPPVANGHAVPSQELAPWAQQTPHAPRHGSSGFTGFVDPSPRTGIAQGVAISWNGNPWSLLKIGALNGLLSMLTLGIYRFWGTTEVRKRIWSFIRLEGEPLAYTGTGGELFKGFLIVFFAVLMPLFLGPLVLAIYLGEKSGAAVTVQFASYALIFFLTGVAIYRGWSYRLARTNWRGIRGSLKENSWRYGWSYFWTGAVIGLLLLLGYALAVGFAILTRPQNPVAVAAIVIFGVVLAVIPALLLVPWRATKLNRELTNDMQFGSRPFSFTGVAKPLYSSFVARWIGVLLLAIVTMILVSWLLGPSLLNNLPGMPTTGPRRPSQRPGPMGDLSVWRLFGVFIVLLAAWFVYSIITAWYRAVEANYFASQTHYENATFQLDIKGRGLVWVAITNWLIQLAGIAVIMLGVLSAAALGVSQPSGEPPIVAVVFGSLLAIVGYFMLVAVRPVIQARTLQYYVDHLRLIGPIDASAIAQNEAALSKTGEGLAGAFDVSF